jgi:hypothetical protein
MFRDVPAMERGPADRQRRRPAADHAGDAQPKADPQLSMFPLAISGQAGRSTPSARRPGSPVPVATHERDRSATTVIWDGERQAFNVGVLKQVMLTRGFTAETLQEAAGIGHGTMYNVLAGRRVRLSTAGQILEKLATTPPVPAEPPGGRRRVRRRVVTVASDYTVVMVHPVSVRFHDKAVADRLKSEAAARDRSASALAEELIDEGLRIRRHPRITFRDGPTGRRAALVDGPDIWEVIDGVVGGDIPAGERVARAAERLGLRPEQVEAALAYYAEFTDEIDDRIARNHAAADEAESLWRRQQDLLAG